MPSVAVALYSHQCLPFLAPCATLVMILACSPSIWSLSVKQELGRFVFSNGMCCVVFFRVLFPSLLSFNSQTTPGLVISEQNFKL